MKTKPRILVAGGGPVGVVVALAAAQAGFAVTVLETEAAVQTAPRAATTHPSTLDMIERLGLLDRFIAEGLVARHFQFWDKTTRTLVAEFDHDVLASETKFPFVVQTEQHKLAIMAFDALKAFDDVDIHFSETVSSFEQDGAGVTVTTVSGRTHRGDWLVGADGGRSTVRKLLNIDFEGYTFPERFLVLTVLDDFEQLMGCKYRCYFADPAEWSNLFKVSGDDYKGRWRMVSPAGDESDDKLLSEELSQARLNRLLPQAKPYAITHHNIYRVHQRVAAKFRGGRVVLAGDAAHVNNPIGGLGLNFGIHDAIDLIDTLSEIEFGGADDVLLDRYERRRRTLNIEFVQQQTIANKKRLEERDPAVRQANLDDLKATAADPSRHKAFLMRSSLIDSVRKAATID